jgi:hypothetical protein
MIMEVNKAFGNHEKYICSVFYANNVKSNLQIFVSLMFNLFVFRELSSEM